MCFLSTSLDVFAALVSCVFCSDLLPVLSCALIFLFSSDFTCFSSAFLGPDLLAVFPAAFVNLLFTLFISLSPSPLIAVYFLSALLNISVIAFDEIFNSFANS